MRRAVLPWFALSATLITAPTRAQTTGTDASEPAVEAPASEPAAPGAATSDEVADDEASSSDVLPHLDLALPVGDPTAPQPVAAVGPPAHHYEDGLGESEAWLPRYVPRMPLGSPHFVFTVRGGFVGASFIQPTVEGAIGLEVFTGDVRLRFLVVGGFEGLEYRTAPTGRFLPPAGPRVEQGGALFLARIVIGGELVDWLSLRGAVDGGFVFAAGQTVGGITPAVDAFVELAARLDDERRVELGLDVGLAVRNFVDPDTFGLRAGAFFGAVL